jgi:hypothetical protein
MLTILVPPAADVGPNVHIPVPNLGAGQHHANVDEQPHNGNTDYLRVIGAGREVYALDVSGIPDGAAIVSVRVRVTQNESAAGESTYKAGLIIGGVDYLGPLRTRGVGAAYITQDEAALAVNTATGEAWTKATVGAALLVHEQVSVPGGLPSPRLTQCVVLVEAVPPPDRPGAGLPQSRAPRVLTPQNIGTAKAGTPFSLSPRAGAPTSRAPAAVGVTSRAPQASEE